MSVCLPAAPGRHSSGVGGRQLLHHPYSPLLVYFLVGSIICLLFYFLHLTTLIFSMFMLSLLRTYDLLGDTHHFQQIEHGYIAT